MTGEGRAIHLPQHHPPEPTDDRGEGTTLTFPVTQPEKAVSRKDEEALVSQPMLRFEPAERQCSLRNILHTKTNNLSTRTVTVAKVSINVVNMATRIHPISKVNISFLLP